MRHRIYGKHLKRSKDERQALFRNLVKDLFRHGKIRTTQAKAKAVQPEAERLISLAKRGDLSARRLALRRVPDPKVVAELFETVGPRYAARSGGYTRLLKLGPRRGDAAPMAILELVE